MMTSSEKQPEEDAPQWWIDARNERRAEGASYTCHLEGGVDRYGVRRVNKDGNVF